MNNNVNDNRMDYRDVSGRKEDNDYNENDSNGWQ